MRESVASTRPPVHNVVFRSKMHLLTLYFLDSGSYSSGFFNIWGLFTPTEYDWVRQSQIDWFLQESGPSTLVFSPVCRPPLTPIFDSVH
jgi:hypothetical protein